MPTLQENVTQAVADITDARDQIVADADTLHDIAHGPASGAASLVPTAGGDVKTAARAIAEMIDGSAYAAKDFANLTAGAAARVAPPGTSSFGDAVQTAMSSAFPTLALQYIGRPLKYIGTLNGSTGLITLKAGGTRTIAAGVGTEGELVRVAVAGTYDFDGNAAHSVGDEYYFDGAAWGKLGTQQPASGGGVSLPPSSQDARITTIGITNGNSNKYLVAGTADGRVLVWGDTASFAFNPVGDRYTAYELPVPWASTISVEAIYCGLNYVLFQTDEATDNLYHIGSGAHGQAGNGGTTAHTQITKVGGLTGVKISRVYTEANRSGAEAFWFALTSLGRIYSCGYSGAQHVMGYNNTANLTTPRLMTEADGTTPLTGIVGMAVDTAYAPVAAWTSGGKLLRWGAGTSGAHGNNSTSAMTWPDYLETAHGSGTDRTDIAQAVVTGYSTYANMWLRTTAGKIEVAGQRQYGNGDGAALGAAAVTTFQPASGAIAALTVAALFAGGGDYVNCLAITSAGQGYLCGYMAGYALLGNGATTNLNVFTLLSGLPSGFAGALTAARISGGASYTTVFIEATISGVKVLASIGYDVYYNTAKGTASVAAASQTWGLVKGSRGTIAAWQSFGTHQEHGLAVLNTDGELRTAGPSDQGQAGVSGGQTTAIDILQPVRTGLPRLLKVPVLRGAYSAVTEYSYQDEVTDQGGTWRYIHATASTGNAPPTLPTTSNTYWRCVAEPGDAGFANIVFDFDGGTSALTTGMKCRIPISFDATIMSHTLIADTTGSIVLDVWKDTYANYPPTVADTIAAAAKPTLSAAQKATDSTLTGWTTTINAGDILLANIDSVSGITNAVLTLKVQRTT